mmetsp:Transcript_64056/g.101956  ORF Transcript_64056/g.101956 Transcript_64056/m.101956 type:complete len:99 (-) Transcript_64056:94-390(-)
MLTGKSPVVTTRPRAATDGAEVKPPSCEDSDRVVFQSFDLKGLPQHNEASSPHLPGLSVSPAANRRPGPPLVLQDDLEPEAPEAPEEMKEREGVERGP